MICLWQRTIKLQRLGSSCKLASNCFAMDSIELSLILDCFGDQITIKSTKTYTIWLETIAKVLNMPIELKGNNYYSKVFKRVNYKLQNNTFWVVIKWPITSTVRGVEIRLSLERIFHIFDISSVGLRVYESKVWPTVLGFEPRKAIQRMCGFADT